MVGKFGGKKKTWKNIEQHTKQEISIFKKNQGLIALAKHKKMMKN